jgi:hypothetical protein
MGGLVLLQAAATLAEPSVLCCLPQFAEAGEQVLASIAGNGSGGGEAAGAGRHLAHLFTMPWRAAAEGSGSGGGAERSRLRNFVESLLRMDFLPSVYVDFRLE